MDEYIAAAYRLTHYHRSPLTASRCSPRESLLINVRGFWYLYVSSVSLIFAYILMRSGSPLGELAAQQTEGGAMFCENRQRKNVALHV